MLSLHTNAAALSTQNSLSSTQKSLATSMTRLGTGYRVNSAMDDAAGLQIATRLDSQTRGMAVAQRNTQNGISMLQTGEGALNEVSNILLRMKDLATEAFSASSTATDKTAMQGEYDALGTELTNIVKNTSFGGTQLFSNGTTIDGTLGKMSAAMNFQIGASAGETMSVNASTQLTALTTSLAAISTQYAATPAAGTELSATANTLLTTIGTAIDKVGELRATFGAAANRLDHVYNNLQNMSTNTSAAKGRIMDTDFAAESSTMTTKQMLMQSGTAMLKQSNSMSGLVMSLLG
ncbi:flagellin N-terminal helical domain-containing protein [Roseateles chitosanitabidus]|uniref:flagellin N-terminal helical domain-containing protein n=1 Tax=Roseateles chitosanitabidus TaxID=65048 RepID=UPI0008346063|nr:flagellin [Roseateles chitosanitabidus]MBO9688610.1 Lateral flagellin [Roseateles chitosanitabidus]